ncbi:MAG: hypothetical protein EPO12_01905 [Aquabacterium sp.]|nr:MAG: hypothetical protein EPO12_01905 [Aquabacterium sp.]
MPEPDPIPAQRRLVHRLGWAVLAPLFTQGLGFARIILLARLLGPEHYVPVALAALVTGATTAITALGTRTFLIRVPLLSDAMLHTGWTLEVLKGCLIAGLLLPCAPDLAAWLKAPGASDAVRVSAGIVLLAAFTGLYQVHHDRALDPGPTARLNALGSASDFALSLGPVLLWHTPMAALYGLLASQALKTLASFVQMRRLPQPALHRADIAVILRFSGWTLLSTAIAYAVNQWDQFTLTQSLGASALSGYQVAATLATTPMVFMSAPIYNLIFPTLARQQGDAQRFRQTLSSAVWMLLASGVLMLLVFVALSPLVFDLALGHRWSFVTTTAQLLFGAALTRPLMSLLESASLARGQARKGMAIQLVRLASLACLTPAYLASQDVEDFARITVAVSLVSLVAAYAVHEDGRGIWARPASWKPLAGHVSAASLALTVACAPHGGAYAWHLAAAVAAPAAYLAALWTIARLIHDSATCHSMEALAAHAKPGIRKLLSRQH